jgi:F0F1-type ATP synthase membrane subunit b/b'
MEQTIMTVLAVFGAVGWVFKIWIINPLSAAIDRLNDSVSRIEGVVDSMQRRNFELTKNLATAEASMKSAHKRLDDFSERLILVENKCNSCVRKER